MPYEAKVVIIGAGVVGLAIAGELASGTDGIYVVDKNRTFGLETSSRNSEVIHAGIYYPPASLKAKLCIQGRNLLYELCGKHNIACMKLGKIVVAANQNEIAQLEKLHEQGRRNGVEDLIFLSREEIKKLEPNVEGKAGLLSPSTGILDSYSLLRFFYRQARERGAEFAFDAEVVGIEKTGTKYRVKVKDREGTFTFGSQVVVNAAGLHSDKVAQFVGIDIAQAGYKLHYCKGEYFSLGSKYKDVVTRLIYPVPEQAGVGIHLTKAIDGRVRLGPNARYVDSIDYQVDERQKELFYRSVKRFLPMLRLEDMEPEFAGIRPKLQSPNEVFRDFVIAHEIARGFPGLINLIGIESPGLTASPAIARWVGAIVKELLD